MYSSAFQRLLELAVHLAFFLVNGTVMGLVGWVLFRTCLFHGATAGRGLAGFWRAGEPLGRVHRWLPLVDSLYLLLISLGFCSACSGSRKALVACILLGPHAKESFFLLVP